MAWGVGSCPVSLPLPRSPTEPFLVPPFCDRPPLRTTRRTPLAKRHAPSYLRREHSIRLFRDSLSSRRDVKRYRAFDPPEYFEWEPDPDEVERFAATLRQDPERWARIEALTDDDLLAIYRDLLVTRLQDIGLKRWVRTGVISKAWLGTGEEAATVGAVTALDRDGDVVSPMIRNAGALHMMGMTLEDGFRGYLATEDSPNGGRDLHIGNLDAGVIQPISHMGTSVKIAAGVALAFKSRGQERVALTWVGDGATKSAACHEGLVFAASLRVPAIFIIQNNQVALGTRLEAHGGGDIAQWPAAYGMASLSADGNNVLDVYGAVAEARARCVQGEGPVAVVVTTFRMGGHATHDEREARETFPEDLFTYWGKRDPIGLYEEYLKQQGISEDAMAGIEDRATTEVEAAADVALTSRDRIPDPSHALYEGFSAGGVLDPIRHRVEKSGT